ncbi:MAG: N-acetyl-gamma-glutamyl-phosphate reductase [Rickettsiales bacterium]|jgi:N-acetyl-gamma-glutamyl-phosphate reductase|nr:N-acetyl-gamma-glutamyl-phosphate reductase [Rickettsiales bacterium]
MSKINISILGASGYTAIELIRLSLSHPNISIKHLFGNSKTGMEMHEIYPHLKFAKLPKISKLSLEALSESDVLFSCLPHGELQNIISRIPEHIKIIDVSADFRLQSLALFEEFYGSKHKAPEYVKDAIYALPEHSKEAIRDKRIIACPGCYPTSVLIPLIPITESGLLSDKTIIIDSKSGASGSGRKLTENNLFCELNENIKPYNIQKHRHLSEMIENLSAKSDLKLNIQFTPQIVPISRGILSTIYISSKKSAKSLKQHLQNFYSNSPFIQIHEDDTIPELRNVIGSNNCEVNIFDSENSDLKIIISIIDNLNRGSSGQAIQNFNILYNLAEDTGLKNPVLFP